jgi:hypothetical protein
VNSCSVAASEEKTTMQQILSSLSNSGRDEHVVKKT